jgi:zinc transport system substrate-binding protein
MDGRMRKLFISLLILFGGALPAQVHVLVSIAPQKYLVEWIAQEHVRVDVLVPPGANSHTYEPTSKQTLLARRGKIWFRIGESFEKRMLPLLENTRIVDQRDGIDLIQAGCGCCTQDAHDPHIWLSPRLLKKLAAQMTRVLSEADPEHRDQFAEKLATFEAACSRLDEECARLLTYEHPKIVVVSHPAFGYFCRDYGLEQLSIEMEGREPTPRYLMTLIETARAHEVKTVFLQQQHNPKGGKRVAQEIGAQTVYIDPYTENVLDNLHSIARWFSQS